MPLEGGASVGASADSAGVTMPGSASAGDSDESLLEAFVRGDRQALGTLAERLEPLLLGLAYGLLQQRRDLAMEAVQETWMRVIKHARSFKQGSSVRTWVYRILVNTSHDVRAKMARTGGRSFEVTAPEDAQPAREGLHRAVAGLSDEHRMIVLLCYHRGLTHTQVAEVLGIPVGTLKSRLHAALGALRKTLGEEASR